MYKWKPKTAFKLNGEYGKVIVVTPRLIGFMIDFIVPSFSLITLAAFWLTKRNNPELFRITINSKEV